jgi:hypothetical protein
MQKQNLFSLATPTYKNLQALCTLSDSPKAVNPQSITKLMLDSPDPAAAVRSVINSMPGASEVLQTKWRQTVINMWAEQHYHLPELLTLPISGNDIAHTQVINDALSYLDIINRRPVPMVFENQEWLVSSDHVYRLASQMPSQQGKPLLPLENEWQNFNLHRLRLVLQSLRLVRRYKNQLVTVSGRYQKFLSLPLVQQYYLLWHADAYHVEWHDYSGIWGDYLKIVQEYLPLLWSISHSAVPDRDYDIRHWNQEILSLFQPLWQRAGLLDRQPPQTAMFALVRLQSLPTALTQVIMHDLFAKYGMVYGEGLIFSYSEPGLKLLHTENGKDLPCHLDLL